MGKDNNDKPMRRSFPLALDVAHIAVVAQNAEEPEMAFLTLNLTPADVVMVSGKFADVLDAVEAARAGPPPGWAAK